MALILFVAAFFCALPYYLVPNLFAFDLMGTECATLIAWFEPEPQSDGRVLRVLRLFSFCGKMPAHMQLGSERDLPIPQLYIIFLHLTLIYHIYIIYNIYTYIYVYIVSIVL